MFEKIPPTTPDAILGLNEAFLADKRSERVNLTIGAFIDSTGNTPVLQTVKQAEERLWKTETTKSYLNIAGRPDYNQLVLELILGDSPTPLAEGRAVALQAPGGTGALRVAADLIARHFPKSEVWVSDPTWGNHPAIFTTAGVLTHTYSYYDAETQQIALPAMLDSLSRAPAGDFVILHGCCHNPTGADPTESDWEQIAKLCKSFGLIPIIDFAYQGFGNGLALDAIGLQTLLRYVDEAFLCVSFSKNFGLYRERTGALCFVAKTAQDAQRTLEAAKICVRRNYSNPPSHGAAIVATILGDTALRQAWETELQMMANSIRESRHNLAVALADAKWPFDVEPLRHHSGMFSLLGIPTESIDRLREKYGVYLVRNGRVNMAGIQPSTLPYVVESLMKVVSVA